VRVFTLFPTADQDPALRRSIRPIPPDLREDAAVRRHVKREQAIDKALARASKAAATVPAGQIDRVTLRRLLAYWSDELEARGTDGRENLLRLLEAVATDPQPPRAIKAYRELSLARASMRRAAGAEADEIARRLAVETAQRGEAGVGI